MEVRIHKRYPAYLPADDDHPYRTGPWTPQRVELDALDLELIEGEVPGDLDGVYLRNTENPLLPSLGRYHPFDGDGMIHAVRFHDGRVDYRNRFVSTDGLRAEIEAGEPLWAGIIERPELSKREGWGARGGLKDASSTDVVVHGGLALSTYYQCGDAYQLDPVTLADRGRAAWGGRFPAGGISAHPKVDPRSGELLFFSYGTAAPHLRYGVVSAAGELVHEVPVELPGPRLPHDIAFTDEHVILPDLPLFWDAELLRRGVYRPRFHRDLPSRFGVLPRRGEPASIRWFEAAPTYVLHFINAYRDGDDLVLDGFAQDDPAPAHRPELGPWGPLMQMTDAHALRTRAHRWRFDLRDGTTREERIGERADEFPSIHPGYLGRPYRYAHCMSTRPGWFLFDGLVRYDLAGGREQRFRYPDGVYCSEAPVAPRASGEEDDGYLVTLVTDMVHDRSECHVFDARDIERGPLARLRLPERVSSGSHACFAPREALAR